ncbi:MAG: alanine racemase [Actinomycetota bacterium]
MSQPPARAEVEVDLDAIRANVAELARRAAPAGVMAVVKADGYGHGLLPSARAAVDGGATWLGVAVLEEALALRAAGLTVPVLSWLAGPGEDYPAALAAGVDVGVNAGWALAEVTAAAAAAGRPARVHLKVDTGLSRAGATPEDWPGLVAAATRAQQDGLVEVVGVWSHLAYADAPGHPTVARQLAVFDEAVGVARAAGLNPPLRHLANSAATLTLPAAHLDLVRPGLAVYGLSPVPDEAPPAAYGLRPAMTLRARLALVKRVPAGVGVSYGHAYTTPRATVLGLVPAGYADGVPRHAGGPDRPAPLLVGGARHQVAGRVCMDQFVVDLGQDSPAQAGDEVVLFGPGEQGEPTAQDWAEAAGTISYEIVTRLGPRLRRHYRSGRCDR